MEKRDITVDDIFSNPIFEKLVGSKDEVEKLFDGKFGKIINDIEESVRT
jgi:hypothetical protein